MTISDIVTSEASRDLAIAAFDLLASVHEAKTSSPAPLSMFSIFIVCVFVVAPADLTLYGEKIITYEGDNIVSIEESYPDIHRSVTTVQKYGDVLNPYYGLNYCYADDLYGFSKNMPTSKSVSTYYDGTLTNAENTEYQYKDVNKDKYPRMFTYSTERNPGVYFKTYITYASEYKD